MAGPNTSLYLLILTRRKTLRDKIESEDLERRISLLWYEDVAVDRESLPTWDGILLDGTDLDHWLHFLDLRPVECPVLVVDANHSWSARARLAGYQNLTVVRQGPLDFVEQLAFLVDRQRFVPLVAVFSGDESLVGALSELPPGVNPKVYKCPGSLWKALEEMTFDVVIVDSNDPMGILLTRALRQEQRGPSITLIGWGRSSLPQAQGLFDFTISLGVAVDEMREMILGRFRRSQSLRRLIESDPLTGLLNRRRARVRFSFLIRLAKRQRVPVAVAILDLDHFKSVNDIYGHAMGDRVIRKLARLLKHSFRSEDIVARVGGEEFLVAMYGANAEQLRERLQLMLKTFSQRSFETGGKPAFRMTFSAGVAELAHGEDDFDTLYQLADKGLYEAKDRGRNQVLVSGFHRGSDKF